MKAEYNNDVLADNGHGGQRRPDSWTCALLYLYREIGTCAQTQVHSLFHLFHNSMRWLTDKIGARSGVGPSIVLAFRRAGVQNKK